VGEGGREGGRKKEREGWRKKEWEGEMNREIGEREGIKR